MDINKAKSRLAKLCSMKEVCEHDALEKLHKWEIFYEDAEKITNWLIKEKFIDNNRFARFYTRDKYRFNKWGRIKIKYALKQKDISHKDIEDAMTEINNKEYNDILYHIIETKLKTTKEDDSYKLKAKVHNHAQSKGYESHLIFNAIDDLLTQL